MDLGKSGKCHGKATQRPFSGRLQEGLEVHSGLLPEARELGNRFARWSTTAEYQVLRKAGYRHEEASSHEGRGWGFKFEERTLNKGQNYGKDDQWGIIAEKEVQF
mgnify:CR=1 FL=1